MSTPDNESYKDTTTLCQPIGEAIVLFASILQAIINDTDTKPFGDYWTSAKRDEFLLEMKIPDDWRKNGVLEKEIASYKAYLKGENLTVAAYDAEENLIAGNMEHLHFLYKLLPAFCVLAAREIERSSQYRAIFEKFVSFSEPDTFVNLNEDLYQAHKTDDYNLQYGEIPRIDMEKFTSFSEAYETINCTENLDEFVLGKFIPQDDKIIFKGSYVTKAIRKGGAVVFEEINFAKPQYLAFLNSLLDDNGFVRLDNGEVVSMESYKTLHIESGYKREGKTFPKLLAKDNIPVAKGIEIFKSVCCSTTNIDISDLEDITKEALEQLETQDK